MPALSKRRTSLIRDTVDNALIGAPFVDPDRMDKERTKYLLKEVLGVDVDEIAKQVIATASVERARQVEQNSMEWKRYMQEEGGIFLLPGNVTRLGKRDGKRP